ncbi:uncharacterized protein PG998_007565 [Apiospora kogelbergensis]|uniref:Aldose 1-epimerase n=1 Tax=Apiospora kogelbergensis TaxID=1337665 RepID=A0AAW0QP94_9PEZI
MASEIEFLPLGAIIKTFKVDGTNIVQGFPTQELYVSHNGPFFGETIGRVANRVSGAKLNSINGGKSYPLKANDKTNSLHGGDKGWGKRVWDGPTPVGLREIPGVKLDEGGESVQFKLRSEDGDMGYPGEVLATITYTTGTQKIDGKNVTVLGMEYEAELVSGADETAINMTNHSYFNLSGDPKIDNTEVQLCTSSYLPVDDSGIPTGEPTTFPKVKTDSKFLLGPTDPDIDDCFVVDPSASPSSVPIDTRSRSLTKLVSARHTRSKVNLEVLSTEPAFQFYTGKYIDVPEVSGVPARSVRSGFCVEPSRYVNAINVDGWKNQQLLKKGEKYGCRIVYRGWKD